MSRRNPTLHRVDRIEPTCVECDGMGRLISGATLLPHRPAEAKKLFYRCDCGAWTRCHEGSGLAMGRPASGATRYLRGKAHEALDAFWALSGRKRIATGYARKRAYKWLARELGIAPSACHIGWFTAEQCRQVVALCEQRRGKAA